MENTYLFTVTMNNVYFFYDTSANPEKPVAISAITLELAMLCYMNHFNKPFDKLKATYGDSKYTYEQLKFIDLWDRIHSGDLILYGPSRVIHKSSTRNNYLPLEDLSDKAKFFMKEVMPNWDLSLEDLK